MKMKLLNICNKIIINIGKQRKNTVTYLVPAAILIMCVFFTLINRQFISPQNLINISRQMSSLLIIATGATFIILIGSIDLSVDGVVSLCGVTSVLIAKTLIDSGYSGAISILAAITVGMIVSATIGLIYTSFRLPSFLVSFGFSTICYGLALIITGGASIYSKNQSFRAIGSGSFSSIPYISVVAIVIIIISFIISSRTKFGRNIYAIGGSERVAELCGLPVKKIKIMAFVLAGALYGLGGALMSSRLGAASSVQGQGMALDAIAAVVMGGTLLSGGKGGPARTILGVLIISLLNNGLNVIGVSTYYQILTKGIVIIIAVAATSDWSKKIVIK